MMTRYKERDESFEEEIPKTHKLLKYALLFLTAYLIILSLLPLLSNWLNKNGFVIIGLTPYTLGSFKYSVGSYVYTSDKYQIIFSDVNQSSDKPNIYIYTDSLPSYLIDVVEVSDIGSTVNGIPFTEMAVSTKLINNTILQQSYTNGNVTVQKFTTISPAGTTITYNSTSPLNFDIAMWRWYFADIFGLNKTYFSVNSPRHILNVNTIYFDYNDVAQGNGTIKISQNSNITIERDDIGINKILVDSTGKSLTLFIAGNIENVQTSPLTTYIARAFATQWVLLIFPVFTILILVLAWDKWSR